MNLRVRIVQEAVVITATTSTLDRRLVVPSSVLWQVGSQLSLEFQILFPTETR
jgi:hypothetical protein